MPDVIVIGGGISGLTAAYRLHQSGLDVRLLEQASRAGGKIGTDRVEGYLLESGPNSLRVDNQETIDLLQELGLTDRMIEANATARKRFILKKQQWMQVPRGPKEALGTHLFSFSGKLRVLREPFVAKGTHTDESVAAFFSRRFGTEVFEYAADPFITGIYAGDPHMLSVRSAFPQLWELEHVSGSVIRGALMKRRRASSSPRVRSRIVSFPEGLGELTQALREALDKNVGLHDSATQVSRSGQEYVVDTQGDRLTARHVIFALPAYEAAHLLRPLDTAVAETLLGIKYPPVAVAYLGYSVADIDRTPEGFGGLIPHSEGRQILGVIFSSSNFENRAPEGHILLTVLLGGMRNPAVQEWSEEQIISTATSEISALFGFPKPPVFSRARLWKKAIPQYTVGYQSVLDSVENFEKQHPGLHIIGNYRGGISMTACIRSATELARRLQ